MLNPFIYAEVANGWVVRYLTGVKLAVFWIQHGASHVFTPTNELWYNETICLWMTIYTHILYIYIYIYIYIKERFGLVWFLCFNDTSTFIGYEGVHTFSKGICPKVNIIVWRVWTCLLQLYSPVVLPLHHKDPPPITYQEKQCLLYL